MGIAASGRAKRKMGLRKLTLLHFYPCGSSFEVVGESFTQIMIRRHGNIVATQLTTRLSQAGEETVYVFQILFTDKRGIQIQMKSHFLQAAESRPSREFKGQFLRRHNMKQYDVVSPRANHSKDGFQMFQVTKAIREKHDQAASFHPQQNLLQVLGERGFALWGSGFEIV